MFAKWLRRRNVWIAGAAVLLLLLVALAALRGRTAADSPQVAFSEMLRDVDRGVVADVVVSGDVLDYKRTDAARTYTVGETGQTLCFKELPRGDAECDDMLHERTWNVNVSTTATYPNRTYRLLRVAIQALARKFLSC